LISLQNRQLGCSVAVDHVLNICWIHTQPPDEDHGLACSVTGFSRFGFDLDFGAGGGDGISPVSVCVSSIHVSRRAHSGADGHLIFS
jgi:hypothetical protein